MEIHNVFPKDSIKILKEFYETLFPDDIKISLIHEDYDVNNLIKTNDGFFSIDNEFVNIYLSGFDLTRPLMDLCVTEERRKLYLEGYKSIEDSSLLRKVTMLNGTVIIGQQGHLHNADCLVRVIAVKGQVPGGSLCAHVFPHLLSSIKHLICHKMFPTKCFDDALIF